jgi:hypothetical protein
MVQLVLASAAAGVPIVLSVRLEDGRSGIGRYRSGAQRRRRPRLIRLDRRTRLLVTHAGAVS